MNARHTRSIRTAIMLLFASLLLTTANSAALAQPAARIAAIQYFDGILGSANAAPSASALMSPDARLHTPEGVFRGAEGASTFGARLQESFSDLVFDPRSTEIVGDSIVIEFMMTGIHTGTYRGAEPGCSGIVVPGMAVVQTSDSGITEQWVSYDSQTVLDQIYVFGLFNPDGRPGCDGDEPVAESVAPTGAPACTSAGKCEMPY